MLRDLAFIRLADFAACLRFFSRWPVRRLGPRDDPAALPELPRAAAMIPLAGATVALPAALAGALLSFSHLPPLAVGMIVVLLLSAPTGALHEDGLADAADGLIGGHDRARRLEIMKDSRIGSFGALALIVAVTMNATLYGALAAKGAVVLATVIVAVGALSRLAMVWLWWALESARPEGLAARLGRPDFDAAVGASLAGVLFALALAAARGAPAAALALLAAAVATVAFGAFARARIGGQTGDILGAAQKLAEAALLVDLALVG